MKSEKNRTILRRPGEFTKVVLPGKFFHPGYLELSLHLLPSRAARRAAPSAPVRVCTFVLEKHVATTEEPVEHGGNYSVALPEQAGLCPAGTLTVRLSNGAVCFEVAGLTHRDRCDP